MFVGVQKAVCLVLIEFLILTFTACSRYSPPSQLEAVDPIDRRTNLPITEPVQRDLAEIKSRGTITLLAPYNSTTYFLYRGEPLGFEYELLQNFAREQGVALKLIVVPERKSLFPLLNAGDGDIVAARLVPTEEDKQHVAFTKSLYSTEPVLVQQEVPPEKSNMPEAAKKGLEPAPNSAKNQEFSEIEIWAQRIKKPAQMAGETVHLPEKSAYKRTLIELSDEISGDIHVVETDGKIGDEALAQKVAAGEVEFTVMQGNGFKNRVLSQRRVRGLAQLDCCN